MEFNVVNPATEAVVATIAADSEASVRAKFERCRAVQKEWRRTSMAHRKSIISNVKQLLCVPTHAEELARLVTLETGRPISLSRGLMSVIPSRVDYFLGAIESIVAPEPHATPAESPFTQTLTWEPRGVVAHISAWNFPILMGVDFLVPCLLSGCGTLYKPSELSPSACHYLVDLFIQAGVPEGLIGLCVGDGRVGRWVTEQAIDAMVFIGSYPVGVQIAAALGPRLIPCITEIGGKDAYFIAADVDIPKALALLVPGKFDNTGQSCNAVDRLFIDDAIYDTFVEQYAAAASALPQGDPFDVNTVLGPITRAQNFTVLDGQVADAIAKGGRIVCGGSRLSRPGYWFPATVIADCTPDMLCMTQETFGPIVSLARVPRGTSDAQIVDMLNESEFGLTGGVFCSDRARAAGIMAELNVGTAYWNCCGMVEPSTPWSGRKHSGIGMIMGPVGIRHCFFAPKSSYFMHAQ